MKKTVKTIILLSTVCLFILMKGCKGKDDDATVGEDVNEVYFGFTLDSESSRTSTDAVLSKIIISVEGESGEAILEEEEINLTQFASGYLSDPISFSVGNYSLTKFLVFGEDGVAYYATPLEGSDLASLVSDPLPIEFEVSLDEVTTVNPEVLSTEEGTIEEFGYSEFGFTIVETFDLLVGVLVYDESSAGYELTEASIQIETEGDFLLNEDLFATTNKLTLVDGYDSYSLTVEKEGYTTYQYEFSVDSIKNYQGTGEEGSLEIVLSSTSLDEGLIAYYPFNGNANDESGNGLNGTVSGAFLTQDRFGNANAAYAFDGVDDYISLGGSDVFNLGNYTAFSVSLWVSPTKSDVGRNETILSKYSTSGDDRSYAFQYINPTDVSLTVFEDGQLSNYERVQTTIDLGWHHIVWTYDDGLIRIYVDGTMKSEKVFSFPIHVSPSNASTVIGAVRNSLADYDSVYEGVIDDIKIYSVALSQSEITTLFNQD